MSSLTDAYAITLKLTAAQHEWLATTANALAEISGHPVAHSAVIMRLMELGAPQLGQNIAIQKAKAASSRKTAPRLRVISNN
ncbi:MAG: hypothetical protein RL011_293 [Pseudomonadota bacterium]|jgi:hypothetical protein